MNNQNALLQMLDLLTAPAFCVKDGTVIKCNPAARTLMFENGMQISSLLETGVQEYAQFQAGCLYLTVKAAGHSWGASVTPVGSCRVFLLESEEGQAELKSLALAAQSLRSPLSGIMTVTDHLLSAGKVSESPETAGEISRLNQELYKMLRTVSNMSDAARFAGNRKPAMENHNLTGLFGEILEQAETLAENAGIQLTFENLGQPVFSAANSEMLERAVYNILSNALKFTPKGGTVRASLRKSGNLLAFTVRNTGEAVPEEMRGELFARYLRHPGVEDGRYGIGLGTVLIRSAAAAHGGTVLLEYPEDGGMNVTMTVRLSAAKPGKLSTPVLRVDYAGERSHSLIELSEVLPPKLYEKDKIN